MGTVWCQMKQGLEQPQSFLQISLPSAVLMEISLNLLMHFSLQDLTWGGKLKEAHQIVVFSSKLQN